MSCQQDCSNLVKARDWQLLAQCLSYHALSSLLHGLQTGIQTSLHWYG